MSSSLGDVLATLELDRVDQWLFVGQQLPAPANHILGGHISAQALLAASHTAPGRVPHSVHTYFCGPATRVGQLISTLSTSKKDGRFRLDGSRHAKTARF